LRKGLIPGGSEIISIYCGPTLPADRSRVRFRSAGFLEVEHIDQGEQNGAFWKVFAIPFDDQGPHP
jgi:hypothetical protein